MQLIDKREKEMEPEDKIRLEMMRTMTSAKGYNLRAQGVDFDFMKGSNAFKMADALIQRFDIKFKDKKEEKIYWPEKDISYPSKKKEEVAPVQQEQPQQNVRQEAPRTGNVLDDIDNSEVSDEILENKEENQEDSKDAKKKKK